MPFFNAAAPPFGTESAQNAMSCGPPDTLRKRTVVPVAIASVAGSNAAFVVPSPVILTSTMAARALAAVARAAGVAGAGVGAAAVAGVAACACDAPGRLPLLHPALPR